MLLYVAGKKLVGWIDIYSVRVSDSKNGLGALDISHQNTELEDGCSTGFLELESKCICFQN